MLLGQYSPEKAGRSLYYSAPAFSLTGRSKDFNNDKTPGKIGSSFISLFWQNVFRI